MRESNTESLAQAQPCDTPVSLYFAITPIQILFATALASAQKHERSHLYVTEHFDNASAYISALQHGSSSPFLSVHTLFGKKSDSLNAEQSSAVRAIKRIQLQRKNFSAIETFVETNRPNRIYFANDWRKEPQYAVYLAQKHGAAIGIYYEDGIASYTSGPHRKISIWHRLASRCKKVLGFNSWFDRIENLGTCRWVSEAWVSLPQHAHERYRSKNLHGIPLDQMQAPAVKNLAAELLSSAAKDTVFDTDIAILVEHSKILSRAPDYPEKIYELCRRAEQSGLRVMAKYHPRESLGDYCNVGALPNVLTAPNHVAFELLLPFIKSGIIGTTSSALLVARLLRPDLSIASIAYGHTATATELHELFAKLGIGNESVLDEIFAAQRAPHASTPESPEHTSAINY